MFETACEKYRALAKLLIDNGISCDIYPQGSFATGTVVRPIKDYKEADYDLDVICKVNSEKSNTNPGDLKKRIGEIITNCKRYQLPLEEFNTCWTITFSEANGIRFKLDVVPSVSEDEDTIKRLRSQADKSCKEFVDDSVAISMKKNSCYKWSTSNPLGYKDWFDRINKLYPIYSTEQLEPIDEKSSVRVSTVEEIPTDEDRTSLQIAIQILKRCRDVYFSNYDENCKPISAIITTLAATIAENAPEITKNYDPFEMLTYILAELEGYSELRFLNESCGTFAAKTLIKKQNGEWRLSNPVNPEDNLLDSWNNPDSKCHVYFFNWLANIRQTVLEAFDFSEEKEFVSSIEEAFGSDLIKKANLFTSDINSSNLIGFDSVAPAKPWGEH